MLAVVTLLANPVGAAEDPFAANVRPTEPATPADQLRTLRVPEGFEVQLVASEPDIHKPMNLAFDVLGRLWVTTSREYPVPAPPNQPARDRVMVFEDFGPDGRARKVTEFASGLNIPIGVYPYRSANADGRVTWKAIVWSIPNLWRFEDVDGDGRADRKEPLYGPFDHTRDTHGNQASFRRGFDGWLYATHGFNNDSHVAGRDGHRVDLNSGNTYRVRLDGSRIEHHTWGQVNPFGLAWDPQGNLYSSDCHSEPIYLLLPGGYYPSFGKPHDGLGFAPNMMEQIRGSTAIDAITYYADDLWPSEYHDCVFVGDVMTSRVYRDLAAPRGSGRVARPRPDFVISDDPWFRPVDTTLGPDGALYIADFYNRIIGHYEVPLNHPGRDRERGRLWRVVHRGGPLRPAALAQDLPGLVGELRSPSLPRRLLAMNDIADRFGIGAEPVLRAALDDVRRRPFPSATTADAHQHVHLLWLLERLGRLDATTIAGAAGDSHPLVRVHAQRILAERASRLAAMSEPGAAREDVFRTLRELSVPRLGDPDPVVRRCAAHALGVAPAFEHVRPLLAAWAGADPSDPHLVYSLRQALRNQWNDPAVAARILAMAVAEADLRRLAEVAVAVGSEAAGRFLVRNLDLLEGDADLRERALQHAARHAPPSELDALVVAARRRQGGDADFQLALFRSIQQGFAQRGAPLTPALREWGGQLAGELLASVRGAGRWVNEPVEGGRNAANPWDFEERPCADGRRVRLLSSFPHGEALTGRLRSPPFPAPGRLSFYLAGHDGPPANRPQGKNGVRLVEAATGKILAQAEPPRNDTAQRIDWDLAGQPGTSVVFEVVDGDAGGAFAWLAFGRLDPESTGFPSLAPATVVARQTAAAEVAAAVAAAELEPVLTALARDPAVDPAARAAAARALTKDPLLRSAADLVGDASLPFAWRVRAADVLFDEERTGAEDLIAEVWRSAPRRFQVRFAGLAASAASLAGELIRRMAEGTAPAGLLLDRPLRERLRQVAADDARRVLDGLVASLPDEDPAVGRLLDQRRAAFAGARVDRVRGKEVFTAACAACHQVNGEGGLVGPQLTGIGTRGAERLCEDVLAPNRNVDHAFWTTVLTLQDGETVSGLFRREEGALLVLATAAGTEITVPKSDVAERKESNLSVMPSNFGEAIPEEDFYHLLGYLVAQTGLP